MIFVTGGTGLIGSHLLYELVSSGRRVKALKREKSRVQQVLKIFSYYTQNPENLFHQIEWVNGDILDYFGLEDILEGATEIYHCAAIISFNSEDRQQMIRNNVQGTANLVNAALENKVKKFCHVSSVAALGNSLKGFLVDEKTNWTPSKKVSAYSESKFFSEAEVWRGIEEGMDAIIVNPSIVLGPGNWKSGSSQLFKRVLNGLNFYTKGITGFVDVKDVVRAMILLMEDSHFNEGKNQRFILSAENWSYQDIFNHISNALEKPRPRIYASNILLAVTWRAARLYGWLTRKKPAITRETAASSNAIKRFNGTKISRLFSFNYLPVSQSIIQTASCLKQDT